MADVQDSMSKGELQLILFTLGNSLYGVPIEKVSEINKLGDITPLPKAPMYIEGVVNLRGNVVPVIDLRKRFGMEPVERTNKNKIIVLLIGKRLFGIVVDSVQEVVTLAKESIEPTLPTASGIKSEFINSIGRYGERLVIILEISRIVTSVEEIKLQE